MMRRRPVMVRRGPGLVGTMARTAVVAGTATAVAGGMSRRQQGKAQQAAEAEAYEQQQQQAQIDAQVAAAVAAQAPPPPPPAPAASAEDDTIAQLTKLGELKAAGILTEEEFAAQKAKILGG
jgi:Short C-terminal domain